MSESTEDIAASVAATEPDADAESSVSQQANNNPDEDHPAKTDGESFLI